MQKYRRTRNGKIFRLLTAVLLGLAGPALIGALRLAAEANIPPSPALSAVSSTHSQAVDPISHTIHLKSREFQPGATQTATLQATARPDRARVHILVQLDLIPRETAKAEYARRGMQLLAYVPDYAWLASAPGSAPQSALSLPGVTWAAPLAVEDKLDPAILRNEWGTFNQAPDGTSAVYVVIYPDVSIETGRALVAQHGGRIVSVVSGLNTLVVELPQQNLRALAAEDDIQWIEPAEPPLGPTNDNTRAVIGVDTLQSAPYNLTGSGIDILIYDSGTVTPTHPDFAGRLTIGDSSPVADHSTHVAGTAAGSGAASASAGGTANQWRGMAPGADIISYGYSRTNSGMLFYNDPGDIQSNWASAQNTYGADIGSASLGSNIYLNYANAISCTLMGNYGLTSVLLDQMIRGGNSAVGIGDKFITTWAAGNERPSPCAGTPGGFFTTSPPAAAKNPIHVGASDSSDNMSTFSSWGPTDDGRIKPTIVAPGVNIKSTIPNTYTNSITRNCDGTGDDYCYPYDTMSGTSMATPAVAGSIALMLQRYRSVYATSGNFWPSTAKAILMQSAIDFGNTGPDFKWGFGRVNIQAAVDLITRKAFVEASVDQDQTDVYAFTVTSSITPVQVSLAWDDHEATFNANPTLINNLDLELESPSGAIKRPWILNSSNPTATATTGINNVDNEEQITVVNPETGTWIVRVKGKTVPQGPQDYSLTCEHCRVVNLLACAGLVESALAVEAGAESSVEVSSEDGQPVRTVVARSEPSAGEQWQRSLEAQHTAVADTEAQAQAQRVQAALRDFDKARSAGDDAVLSFNAAASDAVRAVIKPVVDEARNAIAARNVAAPLTPQAAAALRVGINGACAYSSIQAAVNAAPNGSTIRVVGDWFGESIDISGGKILTIEGGYNSTCTSLTLAQTRLDASDGASTIDVSGGSRVLLRNLKVGWGSSFGAGLDVIDNDSVTLENVWIEQNHGTFGGGIYVSAGAQVTLTTGSVIKQNSAAQGGGAIVYGRLNGLGNSSDISLNCSTNNGGGLYVDGGDVFLSDSDVTANSAAGATGLGGGIYVINGAAITLTTSSFVGESGPCCNTAYDGAGIYADNSRIVSLGGNATILNNRAAHNGGGLYLTHGSLFQAASGTNVGYDVFASNGNTATLGAGIYILTSTLDYGGRIINNVSHGDGAGIYASNSTVKLTGATVGGTAANQPNVIRGSINGYGVGLHLDNGSVASISNTIFISNAHQVSAVARGGAIYLGGNSTAVISDSVLARHAAVAPGAGRGGAVYAEEGSRLSLDHTSVLSNSATTQGGGIRLSGSVTLTVRNGSLLQNNRVIEEDGGAIAAASGASIFLHDSALIDNDAIGDGGAIAIDTGVLEMDNTVLHRNAAARGGAIFQSGAGTLSKIVNSLAYSNTTLLGFGGGIRTISGSMTLTNVTLANNLGGAGLSAVAPTYVYNSIIWGNATASFNALTAATCNIDQGGVAGPALNPLFVAPEAGENYRLRQDSPAIDACNTGAAIDLDHHARPIGPKFDMGAYEALAQLYLPLILR